MALSSSNRLPTEPASVTISLSEAEAEQMK